MKLHETYTFAKFIFFFYLHGVSSQTFIKFGSYEYYIERNNPVSSFSDAEKECRKMRNSTLVEIKTKQVNDFLINEIGRFTENPPYSFFIGLKRNRNEDNIFHWSDQTALDSGFSNWEEGEPNSLTSEGCVIMGWRYDYDERYKWYDVRCSNLQSYYICQNLIDGAIASSIAGNQSLFSVTNYFVIAIIIGSVLLLVSIVTLSTVVLWNKRRKRRNTRILSERENIYEEIKPNTPSYAYALDPVNGEAALTNDVVYEERTDSCEANSTIYEPDGEDNVKAESSNACAANPMSCEDGSDEDNVYVETSLTNECEMETVQHYDNFKLKNYEEDSPYTLCS